MLVRLGKQNFIRILYVLKVCSFSMSSGNSMKTIQCTGIEFSTATLGDAALLENYLKIL